MWGLSGPGLEPVCPALAGGFLTTAPPGKPSLVFSKFAFLPVSSVGSLREVDLWQWGASLCGCGEERLGGRDGVSIPGLPWSSGPVARCPAPVSLSVMWACWEDGTRLCQTWWGWASRPGQEMHMCTVCVVYCFHTLDLILSFMCFYFKVLNSPCGLKRENRCRHPSATLGVYFQISGSHFSIGGVTCSALPLDTSAQLSLCPQ